MPYLHVANAILINHEQHRHHRHRHKLNVYDHHHHHHPQYQSCENLANIAVMKFLLNAWEPAGRPEMATPVPEL